MAKRRRTKSYPVGFGKPPRQSQFKPGQSGNPRGRPKGSKNLSSVIRKVLGRRVNVKHNGAEKTMPTLEALLNLMASRALSGDPKLIHLLLRHATMADGEAAERAADEPTLRPEDELVMANIVKRIRQADEPLAAPIDDPKAPAADESDETEEKK
ncbi:MAG: hypothetical protein QOD26_3817 [Betaproteobacteria bacterium]|jgi:hypothetical protein|nr:hypothetical protein [Betaproteobacteria bacterium]